MALIVIPEEDGLIIYLYIRAFSGASLTRPEMAAEINNTRCLQAPD